MMVSKSLLLLCTIIGNLACGFSSHSNIYTRKTTHHDPISFQPRVQQRVQALSAITDKSWDRISKLRGGQAVKAESGECPMRKLVNNLISIWACEGFVLLLVNSIRRLVPKALEPFQAGVPLTTFQLGAYITTCLFFAYAEGYKGFQRKFAPMVVARSFTISLTKIHHILLGPFYSMGLLHATTRRKIVSWSLTFGIFGLIAAVKRLPYPWKNIVDAGVVVGLSWGAMAIQIGFLNALVLGRFPDADPQLPEPLD